MGCGVLPGMAEAEIIEAIEALEAPARAHDPHDLISLLKALVTGVDTTNHPNAKGDPNRRRAFEYLREDEVLRNGKRTKHGSAAGPLLLDLTRLDGHPAKPYARMLLVDLLANDHLAMLTTGVDLRDSKVKRRYARGRGREILDMLVADAERVIDELDDEDASTRSSAAFLLGFLSPVADRSFERLGARGERETEPWVKASLMVATALVARYRADALDVVGLLESWCDEASSIPSALAWVAALYSDASGRELDETELTPARAEALVALLASGDPDPKCFAWGCGRLERVLAWQLEGRGEAARLFAADVLARAARQTGSSRHALEALRLCFEEGSTPLDIADVDEGRRGVVSELSRQHFGGVAFARFGLPAAPADRRRWLGETQPAVLDRVVDVEGHGAMKLGERLNQICTEIWEEERELQKQRKKSRKKKLPPFASLDRRGPVLTELRAHVGGIELLEALCFLACGAYNLVGRPIKSDDVYPIFDETQPSADWTRATLETLAADRGNLRGSGIGMALLSALAARLPEGELLPDEYDDLLRLAPADAAIVALGRLDQERRDVLAVRLLERALAQGHDFQLRALMDLPDDLVSPGAVAELAIRIADTLVADSTLTPSDSEAAEALRERVIARYGAV